MRQELFSKLAQETLDLTDEAVKAGTHQISEAKELENARLMEAFGIRKDDYVEGSAFDPEAQAKKKAARQAEFEKRQAEREERDKEKERLDKERAKEKERLDKERAKDYQRQKEERSHRAQRESREAERRREEEEDERSRKEELNRRRAFEAASTSHGVGNVCFFASLEMLTIVK